MSLLSKLLIILGLTTAMLGSSVTAEEMILSKEAQDLLKAQCDANDADACKLLGFYIFGKNEEPKLSAEYFKKACDLGSGVSCFMLGSQYFYGQGVQQDPALAAAYWKKGCDSKDAYNESCSLCGAINAKLGNYVIAKKYLAKACSLGDMQSCDELEKLSD